MKSIWRWMSVPGLLVVALMVSAGASANGEERQLQDYVASNTQELVDKLNENRGLYEKDPNAFYEILEDELSDFVDFRRIAARVMGRYARQASPEQRDQFVRVFKRSLFDSYAQAVVAADEFSINVQEANIDPNNENRATVSMEVISASGNRYPIAYSMYRTKDGDWMMENVIVQGVNIGLAFRDRFAQEMEEYRGDIDMVIKGWTDAVESIEIDGGDDSKEGASS
ncbi:phospholipid-binding protein MlaC [Marinobacter sp.]|uniref:MlaC/ttg2D family ABC transporter substrate-binding protein n=1 Tax=Marinobacter sp. TaxID=50741 RepID=UPI00384D78EB